MASPEPPLALHPDRLLPADPVRPGDRPPAVRGGARASDHLPARARRPAAPPRRRAVPGPGRACSSPRTTTSPGCCTPAACRWTRSVSGRARCPRSEAAEVWRLLCSHWPVFRGTPMRYWLDSELGGHLRRVGAAVGGDRGRDLRPGRRAAGPPEYRPRALYERFGISVLATTDDPCSDLSAHAALAADDTWSGRVDPDLPPGPLPRGRPARLGRRWSAGWARPPTSTPAATPAGWRRWSAAAATSSTTARSRPTTATTTSAPTRWTPPRRSGSTPRRWPAAPPRRDGGPAPAHAAGDGADVLRRRPGHDPAPGRAPQPPPAHVREVRRRTSGADIPIRVEFTDALRPLLERFGTQPEPAPGGVHRWTRRCSPASSARWPASTRRCTSASPWWFLDAPDAVRRFREAVTETAGFTRTSGFVDDTRAFCSIPARHDMSRRLDGGYLARLVAEHRIDEDEALETAVDLVDRPARGGVQAVSSPTRRLSRGPATAARPAPVALVHLGLGNFFRAHQAWYTEHAPDAADWGYRRLRRPQCRARRRDVRRRTGSTR